jgi:2-oxoglutarate/2-oxoacid ferredoxin oxidoreductase subunit alpha
MSTLMDIPSGKAKREVIEQAVIRFAGDSGDGMQITGSQFTNTVAIYGNDIATFPPKSARLRAPFPASAAFS